MEILLVLLKIHDEVSILTMDPRQLSKDRDKKALIESLSAAGAQLAVFFDDLEDAPPCVRTVSEGVALLSPPYDYETLESWWYYGNWQMVFPAVTDFKPLDTFRTDAAKVAAHMRANGVSFLVDCFHDDVEWQTYGTFPNR